MKESLNSFTLVRFRDHCFINWISNCYDWETWCHMDCQTGFISWFNRHIHNLKIINLMNNKFFWFEKKISIWLVAYMLQKFLCLLFIVLFCFILQALSIVLSTTSLWLFCLLLFKQVIHTYSTAEAQDLVKLSISRHIPAYFWRCDVFQNLRKIAYCSCCHTWEQMMFCISNCWHCQNKTEMEIL